MKHIKVPKEWQHDAAAWRRGYREGHKVREALKKYASGGSVDSVISRIRYATGGAVKPASGLISSEVPGRTDKHEVTVETGAYVLPADHVSAIGEGNTLSGASVVKKMFAPGARFGSRLKVPKMATGGVVKFADGGVSVKFTKKDELREGEYDKSTGGSQSGKRYFPEAGMTKTEPQDRTSIRSVPAQSPSYPVELLPRSSQPLIDEARRTKRYTPPNAKKGGVMEDEGGVTDIIVAGGEIIIPPHVVRRIGNGDMDKGHNILDRWVKETRQKHIKTLRKLAPPKK